MTLGIAGFAHVLPNGLCVYHVRFMVDVEFTKAFPVYGYAYWCYTRYLPLYGMPKSLTENNVVNLAAISRVVATDNDDEDDDKTLQAEAQEIARITIKWDTLSGNGGGALSFVPDPAFSGAS